MSDEITPKLLVQIREMVARLDTKVDANHEDMTAKFEVVGQRMSIHETIMRDLLEQVALLRQYVKPAIADLRKRVGKLEKKAGAT